MNIRSGPFFDDHSLSHGFCLLYLPLLHIIPLLYFADLRYYALYFVEADGLIEVEELLIFLLELERDHSLLVQKSNSVVQLLELPLYQLLRLLEGFRDDHICLLYYLRQCIRFQNVPEIVDIFLVNLSQKRSLLKHLPPIPVELFG